MALEQHGCGLKQVNSGLDPLQYMKLLRRASGVRAVSLASLALVVFGIKPQQSTFLKLRESFDGHR